jgi:hypothetical protein
MTPLVSLQANGGGRIPLGTGASLDLSRHKLAEIIETMPAAQCREMHLAVRRDDTATAQRLLREAAAAYVVSTPAAPTATVLPCSTARKPRRTRPRSLF